MRIPPRARPRGTTEFTRPGSGRVIAWGAPALATLAVAAMLLADSGGGDDPGATRQQAVAAATSTTGGMPAPDLPARPPKGDLALGAPIGAGTHRIARSGGTIAVDDGPLAGMRLTFPRGAYDGAVALDVSSREITGHAYGAVVDPLTPLVTIEGTDDVASAPVEVTIPAEIPDGSFAMAFYYDARTGTLEGIPPVAQDRDSVTVLTRHFSSFFVSRVGPDGLPETFETGFLSRSDGWQFTNYGSFVARGGHCAGMSLAAMWYWFEQKQALGAPELHGRFDDSTGPRTPSFWQDDSQALRFVSSVQEDVWWRRLPARFFRYARTAGFDRLQWWAVRHAMAVSGEPQYMTLAFPEPGDPTKVGGAHAVVAYAYTRDRLYVYDPNHPRRKRYISWDESRSRFLPYASALKAGDKGHDFTWIGYAAKTAMTDWSGIGRRYAELIAARAGDDRFPTYRLFAVERLPGGAKSFVPLGDGYRTSERKLSVVIRIPRRDARATAYSGTRRVARAAGPNTLEIPLRMGRNRIGFMVEGSETAWDTWEYVDFTRFAVVRERAAPTTTTTTTVPPTTATAPPATVAPPPVDCSSCPPGLAGVQCRLQCEAIDP